MHLGIKGLRRPSSWMRTVAIVSALVLALGGLASAGQGGNGNGAPQGAHYNLNIHGVAHGQGFDPSGNYNGHNIFVKLWGNTKIDLTEGSYEVLDPDGVDGTAAFQLPDPCPNGAAQCTFAYSVWARALTPNGSATMTTCYTDTSGATYCNTDETMILTLKKTKTGQFTDVSKELLQVCDASTGKYMPLFDNSNYQYFWSYDNSGLRLAQLRFYPISTTSLNTSGCTTLPTT